MARANQVELRCSRCGRFFCNVIRNNDKSDFILHIKCQRSKCKIENIFPFSPKIDINGFDNVKTYAEEIKTLSPFVLKCRSCGRFMACIYIKDKQSDFSLEIKCQGSGCKALNMVSFGPIAEPKEMQKILVG